MAKVYKLMDPQKPGTSSLESVQTDWSKCILCQKNSSEGIHCPAKSKQGAGYKTLTSNLLAFQEIGCLPWNLQLSRLDDGDGIEKTLQNHSAKWHDSCRLRYNKTELVRAEKRKTSCQKNYEPPKKYTRQSNESSISLKVKALCFFCNKPESSGAFHEASTFNLDKNVRKCAIKLEDKPLLAKLSAGDMIAQDAKYHFECLTSLYNKARDARSSSDSNDYDRANHSIALADLVSYIDETRTSNEIAPVFKMVDLCNLYSKRVQQLGTNITGRVHSTDLKNRLLAYYPDLEAHKSGRETILVFNEDIAQALRKACDNDGDDDAVQLARAANILRRDMFKIKAVFNDSFDKDCQKKSVPASLLALVGMVLDGPRIKDGSIIDSSTNAAQLSISQLFMFNSIKRRRVSGSGNARHSKQRETPLPVYLGMMLHAKTRKRELVDSLFDLGLCISYDRVLNISTELGNKVCHQYEMEQAVCPPNLRCGLFTTAAADNIDHNPSSTSAHDSFHGTGISLFQHPCSESRGVQRGLLTANQDVPSTESRGTLSKLPDSYTSVPPLTFGKRDVTVPKLDAPCKPNCQLVPQAMEEEYRQVYSNLVQWILGLIGKC